MMRRAVFALARSNQLPSKPDRALLTSGPNAVRDWYRDRREKR